MSLSAALVILSIVVLDGAIAVAVLAAATGLGLWIVRGLGLAREPIRWQLLPAMGLGLGGLALLVLGLGVCGVLGHGVHWAIVVALIAAGAMAARRIVARDSANDAKLGAGPDDGSSAAWRWLWLGAAPFALFAICAATCPPGYLWPAEGNGYDVLEYHFGGPKEYWAAGRIEYLPHNIYTNFPSNTEMLYLLCFVLKGTPWEGVYAAQLLNVLLGVLAVAGAWLAGWEFSRSAGIVAGLAVATCPFGTYLSGVAYVENCMLAMTSLALACVFRGRVRDHEASTAETSQPDARASERNSTSIRWALCSGLLAGIACGCKYSAVPFVALPIVVAWLIVDGGRVRRAGACAFAAMLVFAPWLVRNAAWTGNPVFPLARGLIHERPGIWTDEAAARWTEGHKPDPAERSAVARLRAAANRTAWNPLFGPLPWLAAVGAGLTIRRRRTENARHAARSRRLIAACAAFVLIVVAGWAAGTHLVDRFAIPIVAPLAVLIGTAAATRGARRTAIVVALVLVLGWNLATLSAEFARAGVFQVAAFGQTELMRAGQWPGYEYVAGINAALRDGGKVVMVGEARAFYLDGRPHYCVVFNRNPFAEAVAARPNAWGDWLREQGYTHVYVGWSEIRRLARSRYGFWPSLAGLRPSDYESAGLIPQQEYRIGAAAYGTLYSVGKGATLATGQATSRSAE